MHAHIHVHTHPLSLTVMRWLSPSVNGASGRVESVVVKQLSGRLLICIMEIFIVLAEEKN